MKAAPKEMMQTADECAFVLALVLGLLRKAGDYGITGIHLAGDEDGETLDYTVPTENLIVMVKEVIAWLRRTEQAA